MEKKKADANALLIEPFYTGSHKVLMDMVYEALLEDKKNSTNVDVRMMTLPGKKWHWRARTSALYFSQNIPKEKYTCIFVSSVLPLHELVGLRPDLHGAKKIVYFHENQLIYPVRKSKDRDFQYGYNQILTCLAADQILFNSAYNQQSFLDSITRFFKLQPDHRPKGLQEEIKPKCRVKYFPLDFQKLSSLGPRSRVRCTDGFVRILWPHRWEFDKNPDLFFRVIYRLVDSGIDKFKLLILGESFTDYPPIFDEAKTKLHNFIENFGYLNTKEEYYQVLARGDIVVSTADHEFFGVAMMEATYLGCLPICPNALVYPELYHRKELLYKDEDDLYTKLKMLIMDPSLIEKWMPKIDFDLYDWNCLKTSYTSELLNLEKD